MKKIFLLAAVALIAVSAVNAQEFQKGDLTANVGMGLSENPLRLGGSFEYGIADNVFDLNGLTFGLGAELGFGFKSNYSVVVIGVRAPFHYSPVDKLDLYTAPGLYCLSWKNKNLSDTHMQFGWTFIGARYFFSSNIGAFLELGFDTALGMGAGVAFKF